MAKLDELRQILDQRQRQKRAASAARAAREAEQRIPLEVAVQEDLPKWIAILEVAVKRKVDTRDLVTKAIYGRNFLFFKTPTRHFVKVAGAPPIDVSRVRDYTEYAKQITEKLGPPFKLTWEDRYDEYNHTHFCLTY